MEGRGEQVDAHGPRTLLRGDLNAYENHCMLHAACVRPLSKRIEEEEGYVGRALLGEAHLIIKSESTTSDAKHTERVCLQTRSDLVVALRIRRATGRRQGLHAGQD